MRTKRIFAVVVALGLVAGNVWPHDIASDIDVETSAEVVAEQEPQPAVADSVTMAADTVKKQNFFKKVGAYFKRSNHFDPSKKIDFGVIGGPFYASATGVGIGLVASGLYRIDRNDVTLPLSNVSIFANVATSGMMALGVRGNNVFPRERYKLDYTVYFYTFPSKIWGVGYDAGNIDDNERNYSRIKFEAKPRFLWRVFDNAYVGPVANFQYVKMTDLNDDVIGLVGSAEKNFMAVGACRSTMTRAMWLRMPRGDGFSSLTSCLCLLSSATTISIW